MCMRCVIAAVLTGKMTPEEMASTGSLEEAIALAQDRMHPEPSDPDLKEWLAETVADLEAKTKANNLTLAWINAGFPANHHPFTISSAVHRMTGNVVIRAAFKVSSGEATKYLVVVHDPMNPNSDVKTEYDDMEGAHRHLIRLNEEAEEAEHDADMTAHRNRADLHEPHSTPQ